MTDQPIELGGEVLEAYVQDRIAAARVQWEAERDAAEQKRSDLLRSYLKRNEHDPIWIGRRDAARAARDKRHAEITAAQARESA